MRPENKFEKGGGEGREGGVKRGGVCAEYVETKELVASHLEARKQTMIGKRWWGRWGRHTHRGRHTHNTHIWTPQAGPLLQPLLLSEI